MPKKPKREEKREKRAERTSKSCGEEAREHPRACSRVGGDTSKMDQEGPGGVPGGVVSGCGARSSTKSLKSL